MNGFSLSVYANNELRNIKQTKSFKSVIRNKNET